ncbi:MAG: hypothetical protein NVS9B10_06050 [Nevskia sp.]
MTALARNANQNVVPGATVLFTSADEAGIIVTQGTTDASGLATAVVTTGGNPQNRKITINASSGNASGSVSIAVVGTTLALSGPTNAQSNTPVPLTATLTDAGGKGIANAAVQVTSAAGNVLSASTLTTSSTGQVSFTLTGTNTSRLTDTVTATALGTAATTTITFSPDNFGFTMPASNKEIALNTNQTIQVRWLQNGNPVSGQTINFSTTRGTVTPTSVVTDASGLASATVSSTNAGFATIQASSSGLTKPSNTLQVEFVAINPTSINIQPSPAVIATGSQSNIGATVRDVNNNLVKNAVVDFTLNDTTGGTLSSPTATTNSQGVAIVVYTASSTPSASNGVRITATVRGVAVTSTGTLTVGSRALRITLGTGNQIFKPNATTYQLPYSAIVTDSAGNPVPNASFNLSVTSLRYAKGYYVVPAAGGNPTQTVTAVCVNEDTNGNGVLDPGEDINGNGVLDPGNVASVPGSATLGSDGTAQFNITYPQDRGNWVAVRLTARASVSGTESVENRDFVLPIAVVDQPNPPGSPSPYGIASNCSNPN